MKAPRKYAAIVATIAALIVAVIYANSDSRVTTTETHEEVSATGESVTNSHGRVEQYQRKIADSSVVRGSVPPLSEYAGFGHNPERDEAQYQREEQEREKLVADCMISQDYKYTPEQAEVITGEVGEEELEKLLTSTDPNDEYVASLSKKQREAWYIALTGVPDPNSPEAADLPDFEIGGGCTGEALRKIPGVYALRQQLRPELEAMEEAIVTDARVVAANEQWSRCMQEKGYDFLSPSAMHSALEESIGELLAEDTPSTDEQIQLEAQHKKALQVGGECDTSLSRTIKAVRTEQEKEFVDQYREILN